MSDPQEMQQMRYQLNREEDERIKQQVYAQHELKRYPKHVVPEVADHLNAAKVNR